MTNRNRTQTEIDEDIVAFNEYVKNRNNQIEEMCKRQ
jgi:hypothetical protein